MENKAHALAAGTFVLLLAALLVALALWLTRDAGNRVTYDVSTNAPVTGLQEQASVRFRGVKVGKVVSIGFDTQEPGNVLVRLVVDVSTPVTRSTFASLGFQGVTGIAFVQLDDSGESKERLPTDGLQPSRIPMRPGLVGQLSERSGRILNELEETSRRVKLLLAAENQKTLMRSIDALGQAAASLPPVMKEAGATLRSLRAAGDNVAGGAEAVKQAAGDYRQLALRAQQPGGALDQLAQGAGQLQTDTLPRLGRALDDTSRAVRQVGRMAGTLQEQPQLLLFGSGGDVPGPGEPGFVAPPLMQGGQP